MKNRSWELRPAGSASDGGRRWRFRLVMLLLSVLFLASTAGAEEKLVFPEFRMQEIETGLKVGYAVLLVDVDGDGKKDIVVVDTNRVVWYQNPTWKRRTIIENQTAPDNVCIAAYDIDGDGQLDFALGADWKPFNTKSGGTIQWLKRGKTLDDKWTVYPIGEEPTVHRMRFADLDGSGKAQLIVAPLMGRGATKEKNWMDGSPVRILSYKIPKDPIKDRWVPEVIDESLHVVHNIRPSGSGLHLLTASYEGIHLLPAGKKHLGTGNQANPGSNRGSSEAAIGLLTCTGTQSQFIATIEPWHGNQVVVYTFKQMKSALVFPGERQVIDEKLKWGHAVWCADLETQFLPTNIIVPREYIIVGVRDDLSTKPDERRGVRIYKALDDKGTKWARHDVDPGGVAVEDLAAADLDGDGKIDIVAVGRQTGNVRIYWNLGTRK
jgi:hypothetical protein